MIKRILRAKLTAAFLILFGLVLLLVGTLVLVPGMNFSVGDDHGVSFSRSSQTKVFPGVGSSKEEKAHLKLFGASFSYEKSPQPFCGYPKGFTFRSSSVTGRGGNTAVGLRLK